MGENRGKVSHVEILLIPKHNQEWLEAQRKQREEKEFEGCSFKPSTLAYQAAGKKQ
jgi:hypothetical protein